MRSSKELNEKVSDNIFFAKVANALGYLVRITIFRHVKNENQIKNNVFTSDFL
ncbi:MAG: hypothetical protein PVH88_07105 [Ignavibacteria bacterium]|jgi:hypothetical protein